MSDQPPDGYGSPGRVQLSRAKGWQMPPNTVSVARPTRWGNPYVVGQGSLQFCGSTKGGVLRYGRRDVWCESNLPGGLTVEQSIALYRQEMDYVLRWADTDDGDQAYYIGLLQEMREALAGKNLACWCPLDQPCHADVLLDVANATHTAEDQA